MLEKIHGFLWILVIAIVAVHSILYNKELQKYRKNKRVSVKQDFKILEKRISLQFKNVLNKKKLTIEQKQFLQEWQKNTLEQIQKYKINWDRMSLRQQERIVHSLETNVCEDGLDLLNSDNPEDIESFFSVGSYPADKIVGFIVLLFVFIVSAYSYLALCSIRFGIVILSCIWGYFLFYQNILHHKKYHPIQKEEILNTIYLILVFIGGFFLNQWVYEQPDTVQMWVTLLLPVIYGIIYYALRHKRKIREI